jgi:DNA adenine methylase
VYDKVNVMEWHKFLQKVSIHSGQWKDCCDNIQGRALYFFDPPYRDSFTQYGTDFDDSRHLELIEFCKTADQAGHLVMYCNREAGDDFYTKNRGQLGLEYYDITYTAGRRKINDDGSQTAKQAKEILLYSNSIKSLNCTPPVKATVPPIPKPKKFKTIQIGNSSLFDFT